MEIEQLSFEVKTEINSFYDGIKGDVDYYCQSEIIRMEQVNEDTKDLMAIYLKWISIIESTQNQVMNSFKNYIAIEANMINKTKPELLKMHQKSIIYITGEDMEKTFAFKGPNIGCFIYFNWCPSQNQLDFIKWFLVKPELKKDIKTCFNEVNIVFSFQF